MRGTRNNKTRKRFLCWLVTAVMLLTGVNVSAAEFSAPQEGVQEDVFSSGDYVEDYVEPEASEEALTEESEQDTEVFTEQSQESGADMEAQVSEAAEAGSEEVSGENLEATENVTPEEEEIASAGVSVGDPLQIVFADKNGKIYDDLTISAKISQAVKLPQVPGYENANGSGWKWEKAGSDEDMLDAGDTITIAPDDLLVEYIENGVLTLYAVQGEALCTVTFYNNGGTSAFQTQKVAKGASVTLPDFPRSGYINKGWAVSKGSAAVKYQFGSKITVNGDIKLYMVRYAAVKVTFLETTGHNNNAFRALCKTVEKGSKIKFPTLPDARGYNSLGWSTRKNAASAAYKTGKTYTVTQDITFYAVRKKVGTYTVTFNNNAGTSKSKVYTALKQKVTKNQYITLPEVPKAAGYENLGWTTTKQGKKVSYKEGAKIKVTKNLKLYAVRRKSKYYTVTFYLGNGSSNSSYKAIQKKVKEGSKITLPSVPKRKGYVGLGWNTKKNKSTVTNKAGTAYKVTKNMKFYAVQKQAVSVVLHKNDGTVWKTLSIGKGDSLKLPGAQSSPPYTMLGWSRTKYQTSNPTYEVGETVRKITKTMHFYAVVFNRNAEQDYSASQLPKVNLQKYKKVIFVGDSRVHRMSRTLSNLSSQVTSGVSFVYKEGGGLNWLKSDGYTALKKAVGTGSSKKTAVIFNLGVNDLGNINNYIIYMRDIAKELKSRGCELYYMSVNPVNNQLIKAAGKTSRPEETVRSFNASIKGRLCSGSSAAYQYIDTYSYLIKYGYGTDASTSGTDIGRDDGLHYTTKTYKRIYRYCISKFN